MPVRTVMRWLLMVVVCMLPFQFAWSGAAAYCTHEAAPAAFHIGHHADPHAATGEAGEAAPAEHADCSASHANAVQPGLAFATGQTPQGGRAGSPGCPFRHARIGPDIDRPKWTRAG